MKKNNLLLSIVTSVAVIFPTLQCNNDIIETIKKNNGHVDKIIEISSDTIIDGDSLGTNITFGKDGGFNVFNGTLEFKNIKLENINGDKCLRTFTENISVKPKIIFNNSRLYLSEHSTIFYDIEFKGLCKISGKEVVLRCTAHFSPNAHLVLESVNWDLYVPHFKINGNASITLKNSRVTINKSLTLGQGIKIEVEGGSAFLSLNRCTIKDYCTASIKINKASRLTIDDVLFKNLISIERDIFSFVDSTSQLHLHHSVIYSKSNTSFLTGALFSQGNSKLDFREGSCVRFGNNKKENDLTLCVLDILEVVNGTLEYMNVE